MSDRVGYLVEYSKKKGVFDGFEPRQNVLCSDSKLIELLKYKTRGTVWSARWVNVDEYQKNHDVKLEEWGLN